MLSNYAPGQEEIDNLPIEGKLCPQCGEEDMKIEYWWQDKKLIEATGFLICGSCGYNEERK